MKATVAIFLALILQVRSLESEKLKLSFANLIGKLSHSDNGTLSECRSQLKLMGDENSSWSDEMQRSWSGFRAKIKYGNTIDFGNFDKCMAIHHNTDDNNADIDGQYCLVQFYSKSNSTISMPPKRSLLNYGWKKLNSRFGGAICIPASCPTEVVQPLMNEVFSGTEYEMAADYNQDHFCKKSTKPFKVTPSIRALGYVVAGLLMLAAASTAYDLRTEGNKKDRNEIFLMFSVYTNCSNLFYVKEKSREDSIGCLHGLRVLITLGIILLHSFYHRSMYPLSSAEQMTAFLGKKLGNVLFSVLAILEAFFVMSGLLVTRSILRDLDNGRFNIFKLYFQRFLRLTPALAFIVLLSICCGEYFSQTAPYAFKKDLVEACQRHWLATVLHLQVYNNPTDLCMLTTWYLSVEWQMFLLAPILIYPAWKYGRSTLLLLLPGLIVASTANQIIALFRNRVLLKDFTLAFHPNEKNYQLMYLPTHVRGCSFLVGMLLGYILYHRDEKSKMGSKFKIFMWSLVVTCFIGNMLTFWSQYWNYQTSFIINAVFGSTYRLLFSIPFAWLIFALMNGSGEIINKILSHKFWIPFGKLGLCIYLVHPVLQYSVLSSQRHPINFGLLQLTNDFCGDTLFALVGATCLHLLVEQPFILMGKMIVKKL